LLLLGNQSTPLRPGLLSAFIHAPSLPQSAVADKMWFKYRSRVDQLSAITELADKFNWLAKQGVQYWTDAAVRTSPEWEDVRRLAAGVLKAFGWAEETPPSYAHEYVSADDNIRKHWDN
jgi:hypothetical protein